MIFRFFRSIDICIGTNSIYLKAECKQSKINKVLSAGLEEYDHKSLFTIRLGRFFESGTYEHHIDNLIDQYKHIKGKMKANMHMSHLQTILNQWCSSRRFGCKRKPCPFNCGHKCDDLEHVLTCNKFQSVFHAKLNQKGAHLTRLNCLLLTHDDTIFRPAERHYAMLYVATCFHCFNGCRHGSTFGTRLVTFNLKRLSLHCRTTGCLVRSCMARRIVLEHFVNLHPSIGSPAAVIRN